MKTAERQGRPRHGGGVGGDSDRLNEMKSSEPSGHHGVAAAAAKTTPLRSSRNRNTEDVIHKKQTFMLFTTVGVKKA